MYWLASFAWESSPSSGVVDFWVDVPAVFFVLFLTYFGSAVAPLSLT